MDKAQELFSNFWTKKTNRIITGLVAAAIIALIFVIVMLRSGGGLPEAFAGEVDIKPAKQSEFGIDLAAGFVITAEAAMTDDLVEKAFTASPEFAYSMKRQDEGKTYEIIPKEPLDPNAVYRLAFDPEQALTDQPARPENTWAFQTQKVFAFSESVPGNQGTGVPVNSVIQLRFTKAVSAGEAAERISIEPEVHGKWEAQGEKLTFVPKTDFKADNVYVVTVDQGFADSSGAEKLAEEVKIQFQTQMPDVPRFPLSLINDNNCFRTDEIPCFQFWRVYEQNLKKDLKGTIYAFPDMESYLAAFESRQPVYYWCGENTEKEIDLTKLTKKIEFEGTLDDDFALGLPDKLPAGFYLVEFVDEQSSMQGLFQVTDLSGFFSVGQTDSMIWLNDLTTGKPVPGAEVSLYGTDIQGTTDKSGVAVLAGELSNAPILVAEAGDAKLILGGWSYWVNWKEKGLNPYDYWSYLYFDKELYSPGEKARFFGVMSPKAEGTKSFDSGKLILSGGSYWGNTVLEEEIEIRDGIIDGEWQLPILNSGWYEVALQVDGKNIAYSYFSVRYYEKPVYTFKLQSDRRIAEIGEKVTWEAYAGYFEGTPLVGLEVNMFGNHDAWSSAGADRVKTDSDGKAQMTYTVTGGDAKNLFGSYYVHAAAALPEIGDVSEYDGIRVLNHNIDLVSEVARTETGFDLHLTGYDVDIKGLSEDEEFDEKAYRRDLTGSHEIQGVLTRIEYDEIKEGPFYDPYTLQTYYTHRYVRREVPEGGFAVELKKGGARYAGKLETDCAYELTLSGKDHKGRSIVREYYISGKAYYHDSNRYRYYYLSETNLQDQYQYAVGDALRFVVMDDDREVAKPEGGNILYYRSQETVRDYAISEDGAYKMAFGEEDIPNVNLCAIYFDGHYYYSTGGRYVMLDPADKAAKLSIETDKTRYAPGDTVTLSVDMTDKKGKPIAGTVNINLVDEALLAIAEQYVNFGSSLFGRHYEFPYSGKASHVPVDRNRDGAEMGDGGGDERSEFSDTAFFGTVQTDAKGHAEFTFTLPDNITSWRVIWHAFSPGVYAGSGSTNIDASLDFFVDQRFAKRYVKGDAPKVGLRSAGRGLAAGSETTYTVRIPQLRFEETIKGGANRWKELQLPELPEGKYQLKVSGENGKYKDAVSVEFEVVKSFASYDTIEEQTMSENLHPVGSEIYPTTLVFSDKEYNEALCALCKLVWSKGVRVEQNLAGALVGNQLAERFGIETFALSAEEKEALLKRLSGFQKGNGGIAPFSYGEADLEISALAASVGKAYFDSDALKMYFHAILEREDLDDHSRVLCLWGLAALDEPVLLELQALAEKTEIPVESRLALCTAMYYAGDGARAKGLTEELLKECVADVGAGVLKVSVEDADLRAVATARLAMLGSVLGLSEGEELDRLLSKQRYEKNPFLLEKAAIALNKAARLPQKKGSFVYELDGKTVSVDLAECWFDSVTLLPEQLSEIRFSDIQGNVTVLSHFRAEGQPKEVPEAEKLLSIKKQYNGKSGSVSALQREAVKVTLTYNISGNAPDDYYKIGDFLPAGLRFGKMISDYKEGSLLEEEGERLVFGVGGYDRRSGTITYIAYPAMTGSFTADAPYLSSEGGKQLLVNGDAMKVTIE